LGSPTQIALIDIGSVALAVDDGIDISISREATVEMDDSANELGDSSPITDLTTIKSFYQYDLVGVKCLRWISWQRAQSTGAVTMAVTY